LGSYDGAFMPRALHRLCSGIMSGARKAGEWDDARINESLLRFI
jgi:hypothetical protein